MASSDGKESLMKVIAVLREAKEQEKRTLNVQEMISRGKDNLVLLVTEQMCRLKDASDQRKMCIDLLEDIAKWWDKIVEDRQRLLLTIAEMELESQQQKGRSLKEIYSVEFIPPAPKVERESK